MSLNVMYVNVIKLSCSSMSQCDFIYHPAGTFQAFLHNTGQNMDGCFLHSRPAEC